MFGHVMFLESNQHCVLCFNCVKSCPNGSPQLNLRLPAQELWLGAAPSLPTARFMAMLLGLLPAMLLLERWEFGWMELGPRLLDTHRALTVTGTLLAGALLGLLGLELMHHRADRVSGGTESGMLRQHLLAGLPLLAAGFVSYQFFHIPGLRRSLASLSSTTSMVWTFPFLSVLQAVFIGVGMLFTIGALWRLNVRNPAPEIPGERHIYFGRYAASVAYMLLLGGIAIWP